MTYFFLHVAERKMRFGGAALELKTEITKMGLP